jgi:hypothetical protein
METEKAGEITGFILMFFVSSTILYFVLKFLNKLPDSWNYLHVLGLVFAITLTGILIKKLLK